MKMRKRNLFLLPLLLIGGTGSLTSCGEDSGIVLKIQENDTAVENGYLDYILDGFNKANEGKGIKAVNANKDSFADLANDGPFGYGPDVLYQAHDIIMKFAEGKHVRPLEVETFDGYSEIPDQAFHAFEMAYNGKTYRMGMPVNIQCPLLVYRKDLLPADWKTAWDKDKNNIPDMVETWNDLYAYSKVVHALDYNNYGYKKSATDQYFNLGYMLSYGGYIFGNNNTDTNDIGLHKGEAEKGANFVHQFAGLMDQSVTDDSITAVAASLMGKGKIFATMITPDNYETYITQAVKNGMTREQAVDNYVIQVAPLLPKDGDLTHPIVNRETETVPNKVMGGISGFAVSSYSKNIPAANEFIKYATSKTAIMERNKLIGIIPARKVLADEIGGFSKDVWNNLNDGTTVLMPSIAAVSQVWGPVSTFLQDLSKDSFVEAKDQKYNSLAKMKTGLESASKNIYDAIHTLQDK